ncbi:MAG: hypothetical protein DBX55_03105 [Verrucomicrobia bacterium]|nr:MAG: hypothetical protein DBX55_03105 [Verrucomicrobiota bacterium]
MAPPQVGLGFRIAFNARRREIPTAFLFLPDFVFAGNFLMACAARISSFCGLANACGYCIGKSGFEKMNRNLTPPLLTIFIGARQ